MIQNQANTTYKYELPNGTVKSATQDSNIVETVNLSTEFTKVKSSSTTYLSAGDTATQTITLSNNTDSSIAEITFMDTITGPATFVPGSVTINGTEQPSYNIITGFPLPALSGGECTVITYQIIANDIIDSATITNTATIEYTVYDPMAGRTQFTENTNTVTIETISGAINVVKSTNKNYAISGDTLEYTIVVTNTGTITKTNLTFKDAIPVGATFVVGSVTIDGTRQSSYNPNTGFPLDDLVAGASTTVVFQVIVDYQQ